MPRPHVLTLVDALDDGTGGAERFAVGIAAALPAERFRRSFCTTRHADGYLTEVLDSAGVERFSLDRERTLDPAAFRRLGRFLRECSVDVLHCHKFGSNVWGTIVGRAAGVPVIVAHEHTWSYEGQPLRKLLDGALIGRLATRFVSVSNADRRRMIQLEHVSPAKAVTIPTAYVPRPAEKPGDVRSELGLGPDSLLLGSIAQLRPQKALGVLIEAFSLIADQVPDSALAIAGDGPSRGHLEGLAARTGVGERIHFLGTRTDLSSLLAAFDVGVMSSDFEGLPLFAFECMAHRTPLVATDVGGLPDVVEDGRTGLLVPARDPVALAGALISLLEDKERRRMLADTAFERLPDYTLERIAERFADLYESLLAAR